MRLFRKQARQREIEALSKVLLEAGFEAYKAGVRLHQSRYKSEVDESQLRAEFGSCSFVLKKRFKQRPVEKNSLALRFISAEAAVDPSHRISRQICREFAKVNDKDDLLRAMLRLYWPEFSREMQI